jgi:hypothetical protein
MQPKFLSGLDDCTFYLLAPLHSNPLRIAAVERIHPPLTFCRILELNVRNIEATSNAEDALLNGVSLDEIFYQGRELTLERDIGEPDEEIRVVLSLGRALPGQYFDCELPPFDDTDAIIDAIHELTRRDEVQWRLLM